MKALLQRVSHASVSVDGTVVGNIECGYVVFLGITHEDSEIEVQKLAEKIVKIRLFPDANYPEEGSKAINRSICDISWEILLISQFTLYADTTGGNRPSFAGAAEPELAKQLYECMKTELAKLLWKPIQSGTFWAHMHVELINDGPVTIMLDTREI